ncbi:MAG: hypothetical protein OEQ53_15765 [Saprospiraceae bacterium]|nr:hypothetical protein [Saprospiraceae bacterium]
MKSTPRNLWDWVLVRALLGAGLLWLLSVSVMQAQFATVGGGVMVSQRPLQPVVELHAETPPFAGARAYITMSWTDESAKPTVITAIEHPVLYVGQAFANIGAGLLWLETNDYRPYPMLVSSTVVPLPIPRTSFVVIGSVLPFQEFDWSVVLKVGVTIWFVR